MQWVRGGLQQVRSLIRAGGLERGLDEEIRFHIEQQEEKNLRAGMTADEARRQAYVRFGGVERVKEHTRDEFRPALFQDSLLDLRYGIRALRRSPVFTLVAALTLALGIGATTAVFTVVHGVLLKPLPFRDSDSLVSVKHTWKTANGAPPVGLSLSLFVSYARENRSFEDVGVWSRVTEHVTEGALPEVTTLNVTAGVLRALGSAPAMGRWFTDEDSAPASPETAILMDGYWARRFGRDPSIVGRQMTIDSRPYVVIGVMPPNFRFFDETPDVLLPVRIDPTKLTLGGFNFEMLARLKPGVTEQQAITDLTRVQPIWVDAWPSFPGVDRSAFNDIIPLVQPLKQELVGTVANLLWVVMGTIAIVLVIACANVATLVLVRAQGRHHELAIQAALGAGRGRLARQVLIENLVLGLIGGGLGLLLASGGLSVLAAIGPANIPRLREVTLDPAVLLFTLALSLSTALLFGSIPIAKFSTRRISLMLRSSGRGSSDSHARNRGRNILVVVQVALALILLVGSGLMVRTSLSLRAVPPGFTDPDRVQLARVTISEAQTPDAERALQLQREMLERLAAIPGVTSASFTGMVPMAPGERSRNSIYREDEPHNPSSPPPPMRWYRYVAPGFFPTIGTRIVAGRDFTWTDLEERQSVVVISENLARELWREPRAALGKRIREGDGSPWREIIGIAGDVYDDGVHRAAPAIVYWPSFMGTFSGQPVNVRRTVTFALRSGNAGRETLLKQVRDAIASVKADVPVTRVRTLGDVYGRSLAATSFALVMLAVAASVALVLGVVGIYGVTAYAVTQRTREIGIRAALGATRRELAAMFVRRGVALALIGVACGLAGAAVLTRLMASLLFGTSPLDPAIYVLVSLGLVSIAAFASYVPARGAARVDPLRTLHGD